MNIDVYAEGDFLTKEDVKSSETKKIIFLNSGEEKATDFGKRVRFFVELDGKRKYYQPNIVSMQNLKAAWGSESNLFISKIATVEVQIMHGREVIVAKPTI